MKLESNQFFNILDEAKLNDFSKEILMELSKHEMAGFTIEDVDAFFDDIAEIIKDTVSQNVPFAVMQQRLETCNLFDWRLKDEFLYAVAAFREGKSIDGDSLYIYIFDYIQAHNLFRKEKINMIIK